MTVHPVLLLVEPNAADAAIMERALAELVPSDQIVVLGSGEAAIEFLEGRASHAAHEGATLPRLVLLSPELPGTPATAVVERMRTHEITRLIPVVVLCATASVGDESAEWELLLRVNSHVRKPQDAARLSQTVASIARYWLEVNIAPPSRFD
ncbi:MAG: hypothetical protein HY778_16515 [Betaproteobacteria bacterium]|nr:hypothetical protein [Betaproteobacteria bacterium]